MRVVGISRSGRRKADGLFNRHDNKMDRRSAGVGRQQDAEETVLGSAVRAVGKGPAEEVFEEFADALGRLRLSG